MSNEQRAKSLVLIRDTVELIGLDHRSDARNLHYAPVESDLVIKSSRCIEDTIASDHGGFDHLTNRQIHDQGDDARMREIDGVYRASCFSQHFAERQLDQLQMSMDGGKGLFWEGCEQTVGRLRHHASPADRRERRRVSQPLTS